jgi:hypothetical protein
MVAKDRKMNRQDLRHQGEAMLKTLFNPSYGFEVIIRPWSV